MRGRRERERERERERRFNDNQEVTEGSVSTTPCRVTPPMGARAENVREQGRGKEEEEEEEEE